MRADNTASETIMGPVILAITAIGVCLILVSQLNILGILGEDSRQDNPPEGYDVLSGWEYSLLEPTTGYAMNASRVSNHYPDHYGAQMGSGEGMNNNTYGNVWWAVGRYWFSDDAAGDRDNILVYVIENNTWYEPTSSDIARKYEDFVWVERNIGNFWGEKWRRAAIPYSEIYDNIEDNESRVSFMLGGLNLTIALSVTSDFYTNFTVNRAFQIQLAVVLGEQGVGSTSMWSLVGRLLTGTWPNVEYPWNLIISLPFWAMITVIVVTLISRFVPFIPGG